MLSRHTLRGTQGITKHFVKRNSFSKLTEHLFCILGSSLRTADVFPVVASLPREEEKQRPEIRLRFAGYLGRHFNTLPWKTEKSNILKVILVVVVLIFLFLYFR